MKRLALVFALLAAPASATNLVTTVARADAFWDTLFSAIQDGSAAWGEDYPVQCLSSHTAIPSHTNGQNADAPADGLNRAPTHRTRDYASCVDALGVNVTVRNANSPFSWEVHSYRCVGRTCNERAFILIGRFIHSGTLYTRIRTTVTNGNDTAGQWRDPDGNNAEGP